MGFERVERLARRFREIGLLDAVESALERIGFDDHYVEKSIQDKTFQRTKVIKDGVWGMIELDEPCIRLVDSPLLQRLRGIRQTGFTYLTYPQAEHTRFTHTLGMMHVICRFLDAVKKQDTAGQNTQAPFQFWEIDEKWLHILKHAALLHDCGHFPFSHVIEAVLEADSKLFVCGESSIKVKSIINEAEEALQPVKGIHLAECLSLAIILTPRFEKFYTSAVSQKSTAQTLYRIGAMIAGIPPEDTMPGLSDIISSPSIDADKIDYINRDAAACGIPVGVDVSRLFVRSAFLVVKPQELQRLRSLAEPPSSSETIFVVNASGLDSVEEIGQARTALYHRVYLHQTTRNAERILANCLTEAAEKWGDRSEFNPQNILDIWRCDDFQLMSVLENKGVPSVDMLSKRLRNRQLPKRACVFGRNFARMSFPIGSQFKKIDSKAVKALSKQVLGSSLDLLRRRRLFGAAQRALEQDILSEATKIADLLRSAGEQCPAGTPQLVMVLPMPNTEPNRSDCIVLENHRLTQSGASSISDEQMEAADIAKSLGYVLADSEWREIVFIAARSVFFRNRSEVDNIALFPYPGSEQTTVSSVSRILLDYSAVTSRIGFDPDRLTSVMHAADRAGYFDDKAQLAPEPNDPKIDELAHLLHEFGGQGGWRVTRESILSFISQFPTKHRQSMLSMLVSFDFISPTSVVSAIRTTIADALQKPTAGTNAFIVALSPDSGNAVRTKAEHELRDPLGKLGWAFSKSIRDVLGRSNPGDTLVLIDDNVTSGSQAICQFMAWLDVPRANWTSEQLKEGGIENSSLTLAEQKLLKELKVAIVTAVGTKMGAENLKRELTALGINFTGLFYEREPKSSKTALGALEPLLTSIGKSVLAWSRFKNTDLSALASADLQTCERDALGYDGAKALMCTPTNVPVGTLTALWCPGFHNSEPWTPLLIRRGYLKNLVLS